MTVHRRQGFRSSAFEASEKHRRNSAAGPLQFLQLVSNHTIEEKEPLTNYRSKVFCIGFQKTGTTSMSKALNMLGYKVRSVFAHELPLAELSESYVALGLDIARKYDAVEDMPWPLMFRELDREFPGSKFILTYRETNKWFASIRDHFGRGPAVLQQLTYGEDAPYPVGNEERYREVYEAHNRQVCAYFAERPSDLLVMNLEEGHGWTELCDFLRIEEVPDGPFICANTRSEREARHSKLRRFTRRVGRLLPVS